MRRWLEHKEPRSYFERKIVWAEGQIRAAKGVIWASGAPNDFSRSSEATTNLLISRMSHIFEKTCGIGDFISAVGIVEKNPLILVYIYIIRFGD